MPTDAIIGETVADQVNQAETFSRTLTFTQNSAALDLTGATLVISDASHASIIADAVLTISSPATGGLATIVISATNMAKLPLGRKSWFRLKITLADSTVDVTPRIWIQIT